MSKRSFYLITDTHYFKNSLGATGRGYDKLMRYEQKCFAETQAINESVFEYLGNSEETDTVLIAGDLSFNGEKESHLEFIKLLRELQNKGKRVFVITAGHDFNYRPFAYDGDKKISLTQKADLFDNSYDCGTSFIDDGCIKKRPEGTKRDELFDLYYDFGFKQAIAVDRKHLSYVVQLFDGVRLLALNNDGDCDEFITYDDEQLNWIKEQAEKAKEDGQMMFAMNHYPLLPGQPLFVIIPTAVQQNSDKITDMLADLGVHLVFTGHMHNQSINEKITAAGNKFYDVCTGSVIACPAYMRFVTIKDESTVDIKSIPTPNFEWDTQGKSCKEYLSDLFDSMILNILEDMKTNPKVVLRRFKAEDAKALYPVVELVGKIFSILTVGKACRLLRVKCSPEIKDMLVKNYVSELVRGVFEGNQTFKEGTPKGDVFIGVLDRINPILKKVQLKDINGQPVDLYDTLKNTAGNYGIDDYNAVLKLK